MKTMYLQDIANQHNIITDKYRIISENIKDLLICSNDLNKVSYKQDQVNITTSKKNKNKEVYYGYKYFDIKTKKDSKK